MVSMGFFKREPEGESEAASCRYYWYLRGKNEFYLEKISEAATSLKKSVELISPTDSQSQQSAIAWMSLATVQSLLNRADEAEESAREAIKADERESFTWSLLGLILIEHGEFEKYDELVQTAKEKGTEIQASWTWWAGALFNRCDFARAEQAARNCITVDPRNKVGWLFLGWSLIRLDRQDEADSAIKRYKSLEMGVDDYDLNSLASLPQMNESGEPEIVKPKNFDEKKYQYFVDVIVTSPKKLALVMSDLYDGLQSNFNVSGDPELWIIRAQTYMDGKEYSKAEESFNKALQKKPGKPKNILPVGNHPNLAQLDARGKHLKGRPRLMFERATTLAINGRADRAMFVAMQEKEIESLFVTTLYSR